MLIKILKEIFVLVVNLLLIFVKYLYYYMIYTFYKTFSMGPLNLRSHEWNILNILQEKIILISYDYPYGLETYPATYINKY